VPGREAQVIIKGEIHTSEADLEEEREIVVEGIDELVMEGQREDTDYGLRRSWYGISMNIVGLILFDILHTDHRVLTDIAKAQDAGVSYTRKDDEELLDNSHPLAEIAGGVMFYVLFGIGLVVGYRFDADYIAASLLIFAVLGPVLMIRYHEMNRRNPEINRDQQIADIIEQVSKDGGRVLAVVGHKHANAVVQNLPEELNIRQLDPVNPIFSRRHLKSLGVPLFTALSTVYVGYLVLLTVFGWGAEILM
jgi:hypothetical protein